MGDALVLAVGQRIVDAQAITDQHPGKLDRQGLAHHLARPAGFDLKAGGLGIRERPQPPARSPHPPAGFIHKDRLGLAQIPGQLLILRLDPVRHPIQRLRQTARAELQTHQRLQHAAGLAQGQSVALVQQRRQGEGSGTQLHPSGPGRGGGLQGMSTGDGTTTGTVRSIGPQFCDPRP